MSPRYRGRQAVYIGRLPEGFKPQRVWSVPPSLGDVILYQKNLGMDQARGFAQSFNKKQLADGLPGRQWAFVMRHLKARHPGEHPDAAARRQGGVL